MKQANISTLKNNLSQYLDYVRKGGVVRVFDRNRPVAEMVPLRAGSADAAGGSGPLASILDDLERQGIVRRGSGALSSKEHAGALPTPRRSVLAALIEERRESR